MSWLKRTFAALEYREYRFLWSGSMLATTAFMMSFMLVPSVAFEISGSNAAAGFAQMGSGLAMLIVSPIGGVIADRMRKKPLVLGGQALPALAILLTGILIITDRITVPMLTISTLLMGVGFAFMGPARQAWVAELVPKSSLPNAIALQQLAQNISQVAAPLAIALLVGSVVGIGGTYLLMASVFVIVLPITIRLPDTPPTTEREPRSVRVELAAGLSYVWGEPPLRTLWLGFVGIVVCGFAFQTLLPGFLSEELGRSPTDIGPIFLVLAVSGLLINLPLAGLVRSGPAWPALLLMGFVMAAGFFLVAAAPTYAFALLAAIPLGIGRSGFMLLDNSLLMSTARPAYHGRVMSLAMMGFGSQALLAPVWGAIADRVGVRTTLVGVGLASAAVTAFVGVGWYRHRNRRLIVAVEPDHQLPATTAGQADSGSQ
jgi:predicted MFS family arabinose efflux permease